MRFWAPLKSRSSRAAGFTRHRLAGTNRIFSSRTGLWHRIRFLPALALFAADLRVRSAFRLSRSRANLLLAATEYRKYLPSALRSRRSEAYSLCQELQRSGHKSLRGQTVSAGQSEKRVPDNRLILSSDQFLINNVLAGEPSPLPPTYFSGRQINS